MTGSLNAFLYCLRYLGIMKTFHVLFYALIVRVGSHAYLGMRLGFELLRVVFLAGLCVGL